MAPRETHICPGILSAQRLDMESRRWLPAEFAFRVELHTAVARPRGRPFPCAMPSMQRTIHLCWVGEAFLLESLHPEAVSILSLTNLLNKAEDFPRQCFVLFVCMWKKTKATSIFQVERSSMEPPVLGGGGSFNGVACPNWQKSGC